MNLADLPYLVARVAALESLVAALLAQHADHTPNHHIGRISMVAQAGLGRMDRETLMIGGASYVDVASDRITDLTLLAQLLPAKP